MPDNLQTDFPRPTQDWFEEWQSHDGFFYGHLDQSGEPSLEGSSQGSGDQEVEQWWDLSCKNTFHG